MKSLPLNHPNLASSYKAIGSAYENMGEYSKALSFYERAVDVAEQPSSTKHPFLQTCRENLDVTKQVVINFAFFEKKNQMNTTDTS